MRLGLLKKTEHSTYCPFKGDASYWTIEVVDGGEAKRSENAVWAYVTPYDEMTRLAGLLRVLFDPRRRDRSGLTWARSRTGRSASRASPRAAASSPRRTASQRAVGAEILAAGGNAVDAVVATAFALSRARAVEQRARRASASWSCTRPARAAAQVVDFGPIAPRGLDPRAYPLTGETATDLFPWPRVEDDRNVHGPLSFAVPAAVRGYAAAVERFGRMKWRDLVTPAIALAREGLPLDWFMTLKIATSAEPNCAATTKAAGFICATGCRRSRRRPAPRPTCRWAGSPTRWRGSPTRGRTISTRGEIARAVVADAQAGGGVLSLADLAECQARIVPALDISYRGTVFEAARGLSAAPTLADILGRLCAQEIRQGARRRAISSRSPRRCRRPTLTRLAGLGDGESAGATCTTHITATDRDGGIAALTTTLLSSFGSRYVLPQTGILMNNGIMWFDPRPGRPNSMAPGKRALTNMCPLIVARGGRPWFGAGASGGRRIVGAVTQMASFVVDFGMSPDEAAHHPRVDVRGEAGIEFDNRLPDGGAARAAGPARRRRGRAHRVPAAICLPEPDPARRGRHQPRHHRRDVAVVGGDRRAGLRSLSMNDAVEAVRAKPAIVRPRDAASLILLRGHGHDLELLAGRRPGHVRFMPGVWVFPGGAVDSEDNRPWPGETGGGDIVVAAAALRPCGVARDLGGGRASWSAARAQVPAVRPRPSAPMPITASSPISAC